MPRSPKRPDTAAGGQYRIAAVSKLVGMPVPTIRMWEHRYAVVTPARSAANGRLYTRTDIDRLMLLKTAVDSGHAISTVAALSDDQIQRRLAESPKPTGTRGVDACQVLVCGNGLAAQLRSAWAARSDLVVSATLPAMPGDGHADAGRAEAVIVEAPTLHASSSRSLRQLRSLTRCRVMIVVYGFASRQTLARLDQEGIIVLAMPADPAQLARICLLGLAMKSEPAGSVERRLMQPAAPRRYTEAFLARVAGLPSVIGCECPNHLADLLGKLNAFEQYSLECESAGPADASVHALLYSAAAQCREMLERALARVLEHEEIEDPTASTSPAPAA